MHRPSHGPAVGSETTLVLSRPAGHRVLGPARILAIGALCALSAGAGAVLGPGASVFAADTAPPAVSVPVAEAAGDNETIISVVEQVAPAVVTINVTTQAIESQFPGNGPQGFVQQGSGSGVIIDADGLILTNHHVVQDADTVQVILADGRRFDGTVAGIDTYTDLAFVRIDATGLPTAELGDSSSLRLGQLAIAMGDPLGEFPGSVTSGIVSGLDRTVVVSDRRGGGARRLTHLIQTDAAINPGNSGGPLLDGDGRIIGIDTAQAGAAVGIGFAIPIDVAKPIIEQVLAGEEIARPWIGIYYQVIDAQVAEDNDLDVQAGAWIHVDTSSQQGNRPAPTPIVGDSPAADAGLQDGDIITAIDEQVIDQAHPLDLVLLTHKPGDTVTLTVLRDGATQTIELTLGVRPAETQ
ncbi:MAG: trypsin-like peptidase domain-containing protein [Chloroflexi bacterium]|nr:trypsin-like peptidase domain-containing protein [Chloroflexota bacterium]